MDEARKLLDSLMGNHRDVDRKEAKKRKGKNFLEPNVCKNYLLGFCPQYEELFHSTKRDIGSCHLVHSDALREEFEESPEKEKYQEQYERDLKHYLEDLVRSADDWASREKRNILAQNKEIEENGPNELAKREIKQLKEQGDVLFREAEELAEAGNFEESKAKMELAEKMKVKAADYEERAKTLRQEAVCDICGSRLESGDQNYAKFKHEEGKIHVGYVRIRSFLDKLKENTAAREKKRDEAGIKRRSDRSRSRGRRRREEEDDRSRRDEKKEAKEGDGAPVESAACAGTGGAEVEKTEEGDKEQKPEGEKRDDRDRPRDRERRDYDDDRRQRARDGGRDRDRREGDDRGRRGRDDYDRGGRRRDDGYDRRGGDYGNSRRGYDDYDRRGGDRDRRR